MEERPSLHEAHANSVHAVLADDGMEVGSVGAVLPACYYAQRVSDLEPVLKQKAKIRTLLDELEVVLDTLPVRVKDETSTACCPSEMARAVRCADEHSPGVLCLAVADCAPLLAGGDIVRIKIGARVPLACARRTGSAPTCSGQA